MVRACSTTAVTVEAEHNLSWTEQHNNSVDSVRPRVGGSKREISGERGGEQGIAGVGVGGDWGGIAVGTAAAKCVSYRHLRGGDGGGRGRDLALSIQRRIRVPLYLGFPAMRRRGAGQSGAMCC